MNNREIVHTLMNHIQKGEIDKARTLLSDDFRFSGPVPQPINAEEWLGMTASLRTAFPDLNYNFNIQNEKGDVVMATTQLSGTHRADFDLTNMEMGVIPATNKAFRTDREDTKITVRGNKIISWAAEPIEGAGLMAILKQLGVEVPAMQQA
ncbi:MAG: ester cyclase [Anaerolineales bacterium]|nr:ester cyclase [Anaerolineales bacterium]